MHRTRVTQFLTAVALAGTVLIAAPAAAHADDTTFTGGQPQVFEDTLPGRGDATADAHADPDSGALEATATAQADRPLLGLIGGTSDASAVAGVTNTTAVAEGAYQVTFVYEDVRADSTETDGGSASVLLDSVATFTSADETDKTPQPHIAYREVDQNAGDVVVTLDVAVPESGSLYLIGRATASAHSTRTGVAADASVTVDGVTVTVDRVG